MMLLDLTCLHLQLPSHDPPTSSLPYRLIGSLIHQSYKTLIRIPPIRLVTSNPIPRPRSIHLCSTAGTSATEEHQHTLLHNCTSSQPAVCTNVQKADLVVGIHALDKHDVVWDR